MRKKYILPMVLATAALFFGGCSLELAGPDQTGVEGQAFDKALPTNVADGVIAHAFLWKFNDIKSNLATFASAGYKAIQVSPIQGTKATGAWYLLYQPTNLKVGNAQLGTEADFKSLCSTANGYGIKIIVDAVLNQVADNGTSGGFDPAVDATIRANASTWFHHNGSISNYQDRNQVTQYNLGNGPDWNTQNSTVQSMMNTFLKTCVSDGAGGFRFDAAKHIETNGGEDAGKSWAGNFWSAALSGVNLGYSYGEVLPDIGDNDQQYQNYFDITGHSYIYTVGNAIDGKNLTGIANIPQYDHNLTPSKALVYAENHDTFENGQTSGYSYTKRLLSYSIMIARAGMTPLVLIRPNGETLYKDASLVAVNNFRNAMVGQSEYLRYPSNPVLMIERGTKGLVIVNSNSSSYGINYTTGLAAGTYTNHGPAGGTFTVTGGKVTGTVPASSAVVLY